MIGSLFYLATMNKIHALIRIAVLDDVVAGEKHHMLHHGRKLPYERFLAIAEDEGIA